MLLLGRRKGESVIINGDIEINVMEVEGNLIKLGFIAPEEIKIVRKELIEDRT